MRLRRATGFAVCATLLALLLLPTTPATAVGTVQLGRIQYSPPETGRSVAYRSRRSPHVPARFVCSRPLVVRYSPRGAPVGIEPDLQRAVAAVGTALHRTVGYRRTDSALSLHDVLGGRVHTILVHWVTTTRDLAASGPSDTIATGITVRSGRRLLAGEVLLAADAPPPPDRLEIVLRHELAHAVGVNYHSADPRDLLFFRLDRAKAPIWGPGDMRALAAVGCQSH